MSKYPLIISKTQKVWVHRLCALYAPRTYYENFKFHNVHQEVSKGPVF